MIRVGAIVIVTLLLAACAAGPAPLPDVYFRLEPPPAPALGPLARRIVVEPVEAPGIYSERPLLWARGPALQQYYRHYWAEAPSRQLQEALVTALRQAGATQVYSAADRVRGDLYLRCRLRRYELQTEGPRRAVLALEMLVTDGGQRPVLRLDFARDKPVADASPRAYVDAQAALSGEAFAGLARRLWKISYTASVPAAPPSSTRAQVNPY